MNAYDIEIEYDQENDNYYAEHEFAYPSKRVRLNIDTENSLWPTDEDNEMTITIPSNPQTDANNTWDDTTKTLTLTNLDQNTLITNNQNPTFNYATDLNIDLSNYQTSSNTKTNIYMQYSYISYSYEFKRNAGNNLSIKFSDYSFTTATSSITVTVPNKSAFILIDNSYQDYYLITYILITRHQQHMNTHQQEKVIYLFLIYKQITI